MLDRIRRTSALDRPIWLYLGLIAAAVAFGLPLCRRGIILSDEGYILQQALDLLDGRVLYRDMDAFITPGMWFLIAGVFAIAGPSVIVSRVLILVFYVGLMLLGYRIIEPLAGRRHALAGVASLLLFSVWAFPAWTFAFYSPVAVFFALFGLERLLAWSRSGARRDLFFVGILLGLSICFKQNYGCFALVGVTIGYVAIKLERGALTKNDLGILGREVATSAGGVISAGLPFLLYLAVNGALPDAWQSLVVHPFEFGGKHDIPYAPLSILFEPDIYTDFVEKLTYLSLAMLRSQPIMFLQPVRAVHRMHALAYWIAPAFILLGTLVALRPRSDQASRIDGSLVAVLSTCGMLFLGVLPRADFNHLVNVYQPVLIAIPIIVHSAHRRLRGNARLLRGVLSLILVVLAVSYGGVALYWYAALIREQSTPISAARAGVLVSRMEAINIDHQVRTIVENSNPGDALLTVPDLTMLNFLSERRVPSAYYNLYEHHISQDDGAAVVDGSERNDVKLVVTRYDNFFSDRVGLLEYAPVLSDYIVTHFERAFIGGNERYVVYRRREVPLSIVPFANVLADCEPNGGPSADLRQHLLFSALYHRSQPRSPMPEEGVETLCHVTVPESGGVLSLEVGYRKPLLVEPGTYLRATITLRADGDEERIFDHDFRVVRRQTVTRQTPYRRLDLDLDRYAGQRIDVVFSTRLQGLVRASRLDFQGFAMVYRDPRVQAEPGGARP